MATAWIFVVSIELLCLSHIVLTACDAATLRPPPVKRKPPPKSSPATTGAALPLSKPPSNAQTSTLWGNNGELWTAKGRLMDWSYAGYMAGESDLPLATAATTVKAFGAVGDGVKDDTAAFVAAVNQAPEGVLLVPAGRYVITGQVNITRRIVLRGAGEAKTTLYFPKSLGEVYGDAGRNSASQWSFGPGFVNFMGQDIFSDDTQIGVVVRSATRGSDTVQVKLQAGAPALQAGQWVALTVGDVKGNLMSDLNMGLTTGCNDALCRNQERLYSHTTRVLSVLNGGVLVLERPLPFNVSTAFKGQLHKWSPQLMNVGLERMTFEFPPNKYRGHFNEVGANAVLMSDVANCWAREVTIVNADINLQLMGAHFCTLANITLAAAAARGRPAGHAGIQIIHSTDNLITGFDIRATFIHDVMVEFFSTGNVFSGGSGVDMNTDNHRAQPYANLFTDLYVGAGTRVFQAGGALNRGPHAGAMTTWWNIRAATAAVKQPASDFGPFLNFVGMGNSSRYTLSARAGLTSSWFAEALDAPRLWPQDLHAAMLATRSQRLRTVTRRR